jgi:hypothetical protein
MHPRSPAFLMIVIERAEKTNLTYRFGNTQSCSIVRLTWPFFCLVVVGITWLVRLANCLVAGDLIKDKVV